MAPEHHSYVELQPMGQSHSEDRLHNPSGFAAFLQQHWIISAAFTFGLATCLGVFGYVVALSGSVFHCPPWAVNCAVTGSVQFLLSNASLVQGGLATVYSIGLAGMVFSICCLGEAAIWPLWHQKAYELKEIDTYLAASRGSIISLTMALTSARNPSAFLVVLCVLVSAALQPAGPTFVGFAMSRTNQTATYQSNYTVGGGIGLPFRQAEGGALLPAAVTDAIARYSTWGKGLALEPLPDQRDYILDRSNLSMIGNASMSAIKTTRTITCTPRAVDFSNGGKITTKLHGPRHSRTATVRNERALTTWVDDIEKKSSTRAISTLVFANIGGYIEGGYNTTFKSYSVSALACAIDVDLQDAELTIGDAKTPLQRLSSLDFIVKPSGNTAAEELATWIGVASTVMGINVGGTQPMFRKGPLGLPLPWTTANDGANTDFTREEIETFIAISGGAINLGIAGQFWPPSQSGIHFDPVIILESESFDAHITSTTPYILLVPIVTITIAGITLVTFNIWVHARERIPHMRLATVGELVTSAQTADIREIATGAVGSRTFHGPKVRFGVCSDGAIGLGRDETVTRF